jgi:hypothetical protein
MNYSLVWNTVKYLKPAQVIYQVLIKFKKKERTYFEKFPVETKVVRISIPELDCDGLLERRFKTEWMAKGKVCLLNQVVDLNYSPGYTKSLKPLIYNNVYYFEYGVALASQYQRTQDVAWWEMFKKCYKNYLAARADVKSSYTMALHIPNVLIALELFGDTVDTAFREKVYCELYSQYVYLQAHQEKHLLANHYFEDLKALIIAAYLFKDDKGLKGYLKAFKTQCEEQILEDGVHYELSLMYHKLILEDVMRIAILAKQPDFPDCNWLMPLMQKMVDAIYSLEKGIGRTPLFNDAGDNVAKTCEQLCLAAETQFGIKPVLKDSFSESAYYKLYDEERALIFDAGKIGVDYQPAHGHCDCLSFELSVGGKPLFVNSGTYEYQGDLRKYFRKTYAHNTVEINGHEQSQCWGGFRVAKRISKVYGYAGEGEVNGGYKNYLGEEHLRTISMKDGILEVTDTIKAKENVPVRSFLHLARGFVVEGDTIKDNTGNVIGRVTLQNCEQIVMRDGELCYYSPDFSELKIGTCLVFTWKADNDKHGYKIDFNI